MHVHSTFKLALSVLFAGVVPLASSQTTYPNKPIRMIIPYVPGGGTTVMGRLVGQRLSEPWDQHVILDNRPGAGGIVGAETLARAQPDGYTIMFTSVSDHLLVAQLQKPPYDAAKDFAPVATVAIAERIMVVHPSLPAASLKELIALARSKPQHLNYASLGNGSTAHVGTELFLMLAGIRMTHIPYKGGAQAVTDLVAGQVQVYLGSIASMGAFINSGRLKPVAITGKSRATALPQVPTFSESGLPGFDIKLWYGVLAPFGTPLPIVNKMSEEIIRIVNSTDFKNTILGLGITPFTVPREQMAEMMRSEAARYAEVIIAAKIAPN